MSIAIESLATISASRRSSLIGRNRGVLQTLEPAVRRILDDVRARGDVALKDYTQRFDGASLQAIRVPRERIDAALDEADASFVSALREAARAITAFHTAQLPRDETRITTRSGVDVWRTWRPLRRIGVYVPGGLARYPSCLLMAALPARIAGCAEIAVCTPPEPDGSVPVALRVAAALCGITEMYAVGGVQAIGALTWGTESIARVDKIVGPGNNYVACAKALVATEVAIDMPAGPSEILIVADSSARAEWVAADMLAQAEHGPDSASILVTTSLPLAEAVCGELEIQLAELPSEPVIRQSLANHGAVLVAHDLEDALEFANDYAAEHLSLMVADPEPALAQVENAGSVFLGSLAGVAGGDYATGGNHTLPTARYARSYGPLSVESFGRLMQVQAVRDEGIAALAHVVETLATVEGLPAHAASLRRRAEAMSEAAKETTAS